MTTTQIIYPQPPVFVLEAALKALGDCAGVFLSARDQGVIEFDDELEATGLRLLSELFARAATLEGRERKRTLRHWWMHSRGQCEEMVNSLAREDRRLRPENLFRFLQKEEQGPAF